MAHAAPRHVGDMQQPVDAAEIDEGAVIGDVLDDALEHLALGERLQRVLLLLGVLFLEQRLAREHDVAALLVDFDHAHAQFLSAQRVEVSHRTDVDLRPGQEGADADVDRQAALDPLDDAADDDLALGIGLLDLVPNLHLLGFFAREDDVSFPVFRALEQHVDDVAGLHRHFAVLVEELVDLSDAFGLVYDVADRFRRSDLENRSLDDLAFRDVPEAVIVGGEQSLEGILVDLLIIAARPGFVRAAVQTLQAFRTFGRRRGGAATGTRSVLIFKLRHALHVSSGRSFTSGRFAGGSFWGTGTPSGLSKFR